MSGIDDLRAMTTGDIVYACRRYGPDYYGVKGHVLTCECCAASVICAPSVLAERRAMAHTLGRNLIVLCDDCALADMESRSINVVELPEAAEKAEAQRLGGDAW